MRIRESRVEDAAGIAHVHVDSWRTTYRGLLPDAVLDGLSYNQREGLWRRTLSDPAVDRFVFVAEDDDRETVGFIAGGRERSDDPIYRGSVSMLYLLESHQRMGLGRQLMRAAALQLAECDIHSLRVWVREGNSARHFYEALGGRYIRAKRLDLAGMLPDIREHVIVTEFLFGWEDTGPLLRCAPLAEGQGNQPDIYPYVRRP